MKHIAERFAIHFFSSCGIVLCAYFLLRTIARHYQWAFLPIVPEQQLFVSALCVFAAASLREPYDVSKGQSLTKAITDFISWAAGCAVSVWGLWRLSMEM